MCDNTKRILKLKFKPANFDNAYKSLKKWPGMKLNLLKILSAGYISYHYTPSVNVIRVQTTDTTLTAQSEKMWPPNGL